ncbi:MAG: PKD domain-containing protein [Bacteroidetes bacterium]|nr:MAG: PKD domain-containing protein [Bacteroidota bacterium]
MKKLFSLFALLVSCVYANAQVGTATVTPAYICSGSTVTLAASGQYAPTSSPNWQFSATGASWANLAPALTTSVGVTGVGLSTGYYRFLPNSTLPANATQTVYLTVDVASTGTITAGGSTTVCSGTNSGTLTLALATPTTTVNQWEKSTDAFATFTVIPASAGTTSQPYTNLTGTTWYRADLTNGMCPAGKSNTLIITVNPVSTGGTTSGAATECAGSNSGTLSLIGQTGTIQWQNSTTGGVSWANVSGATSNTLNYANLTATNDYRAVITSGVCAAENSTSVTITVTPASVGGAIAGAASVCASANSGSLTLSGHTGSVVRWESSIDGGGSWSNIVNATTTQAYSTLTVTTTYRALVQSGGCASIYSGTSLITVSPASIGGTTSGATSVCDGTNSGTLSLSASAGTIVWQSSADGGVNWATAAGSTNSPFYNFSNILQTTDYRAVVTSGVCPAAYSTSVAVTVTPSSVGGTTAGTATVCASTNSGNLTLSGNIGSVVRWELSTDGGSNWSNIANTTTTQAYSTLTVTTTYRAFVQSGGCAGAYSTNSIITVTPVSIGGTVSGSASACSGTNSGFLTLAGYVGNVLGWQSSVDGGVTWGTAAGTTASPIYNYSNIAVTTDYRANVKSGSCATANSSDVTITIFPVSVSGAIAPVTTTVCSGANYGVLLLSTYTGNIVRWEKSIDNGSTWTNIANTTDTISYTNLTVKTIFRALVQSGACTAKYTTINGTININLNTVGGTAATSDTVCSGSNSGTLQLTGYVGGVIRWQSSVDGGVTWATSLTTTSPIYNYSNLTATTNFRANVQSGSCLIANSTEAIITVFPISVGGTISSSATVCSGANNGTLQLINYVGNVVRWEKSIDNGFSWTNIVNTTDTISYSNLTVKTIYRALVQSGACTAKYSTTNATITVNAASVGGTVSGTDTICSGSNSGSLILSGYVGTILRWQSSVDGGVTWVNIANTTAIYNYANITVTTSYRAVVQNGGTSGCPTANSTEATITVFPLSAGGILSPASFNACSGTNSGTIVLSGHSGNVISWQSSTDGGVTWTAITNTVTTQNFQNISATTKYRAIVQNGQCTPAYSAVSTINVFPATVGGSIAGSDTVCTGSNNGSLTLTGFTGTILKWEFSVDGGLTWNPTIPADSTAILNYTNLAVTTVYRAVLQSGSCSTANSTVGTILVNPSSVGGVVNSSTYVCDSLTTGTLTLTAYTGSILRWEKSINGGVTWSTVANATNTQTYSNIIVATMYRAVVKSGVCTQAISSSATISLAVASNAAYAVIINGPTVTFNNTSTSNNGTSAWNFGDGTTSTITSPMHTYTANGTYTVQLVVSDSCGGDTTTQTVIITGVGISELTYNNHNVSIYPNPFNRTTTIEMNFDPIASMFKMVDMYGKEVRNISVARGTKLLKLERGNLPSGIYFYHVQSASSPAGEDRGEVIATGKIVIQ